MLYPPDVLIEDLEEGERSDTQVEGLGFLETAGPHVLDYVDN